MNALFLDTSGWYAALQPRELRHAVARERLRSAATSGARLVTTSLVIGEMHATFLRRAGTRAGHQFLDVAFAPGVYEIAYPGEETVAVACDNWIRRFTDQAFSLCDAVSFEVMRRERITHALAVDHHFAIAGFDIVR